MFRACLKFLILFTLFLTSCQDHPKDEVDQNKPKVSTTQGDTLIIGSISNVVQNEVLNYSAFMQYLADSLQSVGISYVDIRVVRSLENIIDLINKSKIDLFTDSPYPVCAVLNTTNMELFLKHNKAGANSYRTVLFTLKNSEINNQNDLKGKLIGFEKSYSTTGFLLPYISLANSGFELNKVDNLLDPQTETQINYIFTRDDENTMYWLLSGKIDAGATDNISFKQNAGAKEDDLKIIYETEEVPRSILMINPSLDAKVKNRLKQLLVTMDKDSTGKRVLQDFFATSGFYELKNSDVEALEIFNKFKR